MRYLSHPETSRRQRVSFPILVACLALAPVSAQATGVELAARSAEDGSAGMSTIPISPVTVENALGAPGAPIPLAVTVSAKLGQSVLNTYLVGLPKGAGLTDAEHAVTATDEKAAIDVTHWNLPRLSVVLPPTQAGTYTLAVVAVSRPNDDGPSNFTSSTFTLKAIARSHEAESAVGTSAPGAMRPDATVVSDSLRPPLAEPPPSNRAMQDGGISSKINSPITEAVAPKALENLWREEEFSTAAAQSAVASQNHGDHPSLKFRSAATLAAPPVLAALPTTVPGVTAHAAVAPAAVAPAAVVPPAVAPAAARAAPATDADGKALVERAERLIRLGDISGARLVLERASDRGDPRATFLLAQTCDPRMLREWKVQGLKPDPDRARALYAKAAQEGVRETKPVTDARR